MSRARTPPWPLRRALVPHEDRAPDAPVRVLLLEADPREEARLREALRHVGRVKLLTVSTLELAVDVLAHEAFDVLLSATRLDDSAGVVLIDALTRQAADVPLVVIGGPEDTSLAIESVRRGAQDFLSRDELGSGLLARSVLYAIERKRSERHLHYLAVRDGLTGLLNRHGLRTGLSQALENHRPGDPQIGLLYLDLDRFKGINDSLGHDAGDELLQIVGQRLSALLRSEDLVARIHGDEFAVVIGDLRSSRELQLIGQRIVGAFVEPIQLKGVQVRITGSVGGSHYPTCGQSVDELITAADRAMYRAKSTGRNRCYVARSRPAASLPPQSRSQDLHRALDQQEFTLQYQPQFSGLTGDIVGYEALIRWDHPKLGRLAPNEFVHLLEETGNIRPVGTWVLREAARFLNDVRSTFGVWRRLAINVSPLQLEDDDLFDELKRVLAEGDLPPSCLEFEFTEAAILSDVDRAAEAVRALRSLGVRVALDDFGTGYSSLSHLQRFEVDTLKIDRSFVQDETMHTLVGGIIKLGHAMGLWVVGEGVETPAQHELLVRRGCDALQGYLLGRPGDPAQLLARGPLA